MLMRRFLFTFCGPDEPYQTMRVAAPDVSGALLLVEAVLGRSIEQGHDVPADRRVVVSYFGKIDCDGPRLLSAVDREGNQLEANLP